jgi:glycerate dehydrogenase
MKIVVLDKPRENPGEIDWSQVEKLGEARIYDDTLQEDAIKTIADAEIVFVNKLHITREIMDACPNIKFISVVATGFNKIDLVAAKEKGILVSNVPSYGSKAIGQHAVALLMEITNHIAHHDKEVRKMRKSSDTDWAFWDYPLFELEYKTMGVIGLGRIGQTVAKTGLALGMNVIAHDAFESEEMKSLGIKYVSLDELLSSSDVISLHCPLTEDNHDMINKDTIAKMKDGVILLNNSRGGLVDEDALADALKSGKVGAAGLDTVKVEPITPDCPLLNAPNCFLSPHISWASLDCRRRLIRLAVENVKAYLNGNPINIVNK